MRCLENVIPFLFDRCKELCITIGNFSGRCRCMHELSRYQRMNCGRVLLQRGDQLLRIVGLYRVLKTHLCVYYRHHAQMTDQVCDAPTVRILDHILLEEEKHVRWGQAIYEELADTPEKRRASLEWQMELEDLLVKSGGVTGGR